MKIPNPYFKDVPQIGNLMMDYIIYEYDYPLLFICITEDYKYYLCDCCDTYKEQRWLLAPIRVERIRALLHNRITIRDAFEKAEGLCCVVTWKKGDIHENYTLIHANEFEPADLPESGEYLEAEENEHDSYLRILEERCDFKKEGMTEPGFAARSVLFKDLCVGYDVQNRYMTKSSCPIAVSFADLSEPDNNKITAGHLQRMDFKNKNRNSMEMGGVLNRFKQLPALASQF